MRRKAASTARASPTPSDANDQIFSAAEYRQRHHRLQERCARSLGDIGEVIDNVENVRLAAGSNRNGDNRR